MPNVISYRVRDYDAEHYVVESYSMALEDEINSYAVQETAPNYYIRTHTYLRRRSTFENQIRRLCAIFRYPPDFATDLRYEYPIDTFNAFLATHYFSLAPSAVPQNRLEHLNRLAYAYIDNHNRRVMRLMMEGQDNSAGYDRLWKKANTYLSKGIDRIECLNVGQANCSLGYHAADARPLAVFDLGVRSTGASRPYAENKLSQVDGKGIVVISHYDSDHIDGCRYLPKTAVNRIWILPFERKNHTPHERFLMNFVKRENCIFLNDVEYQYTPYNSALHSHTVGNVTVYQGNARKIDSCQSTHENARSLLCVVRKEKSILLPGDCLYEEFPKGFDVDYLMVPHHSCYYDKTITNIDLSKLEKIIVCAGPHKGHHHPNLTHIARLQPPCQAVYLMKHADFYFDGETVIGFPPITNTDLSYTVTL